MCGCVRECTSMVFVSLSAVVCQLFSPFLPTVSGNSSGSPCVVIPQLGLLLFPGFIERLFVFAVYHMFMRISASLV